MHIKIPTQLHIYKIYKINKVNKVPYRFLTFCSIMGCIHILYDLPIKA